MTAPLINLKIGAIAASVAVLLSACGGSEADRLRAAPSQQQPSEDVAAKAAAAADRAAEAADRAAASAQRAEDAASTAAEAAEKSNRIAQEGLRK